MMPIFFCFFVFQIFSIETMPSTWDAVRTFMMSKDYLFMETFRTALVEDDVFVHKTLFNESIQRRFTL